jgi:pimeloyl-ACP methyl ester carboxylesterase
MPYVQSDGLALYYERFGGNGKAATPVVWMPGGFGFGPHFSVWDIIDSPEITRDREAVNFFRRCYGPSAFTAEPASLERWTGDLLALVDGLGAEKVNFLGWSASSVWTLSFAAAHPDRVASVISLNGVYRAEGDGLKHAMDIYLERSLSPYETFLEQQKAVVGVSESSPLRDFSRFYSYLDRASYEARREDLLANREWCEATVAYFKTIDLTERLRTLDLPVLLIQGLDDKLCDPAETRRAAEIIPNAELLELEGVGHMPTSGDVYEKVIAAATGFWARHAV